MRPLNAYERAYRLLDRLEADIFVIVGDQSKIATFSDAVGRARAGLTAGIETIIGWFTRSQDSTVTSFDSEIPIAIARLSAGAEVTHSDSSGFQFQGKTLSYFVDVLYVILENCVTKSNLPKEHLSITTVLEKRNNGLILSITNNCLPIFDVDIANEKLDYYRDSYGKEAFALEAAQGEGGGTGFFKVWKALAKDLEMEHKIYFGYEAADKFTVSIIIDESELKKVCHYENSNC